MQGYQFHLHLFSNCQLYMFRIWSGFWSKYIFIQHIAIALHKNRIVNRVHSHSFHVLNISFISATCGLNLILLNNNTLSLSFILQNLSRSHEPFCPHVDLNFFWPATTGMQSTGSNTSWYHYTHSKYRLTAKGCYVNCQEDATYTRRKDFWENRYFKETVRDSFHRSRGRYVRFSLNNGIERFRDRKMIPWLGMIHC
jgi:hypothetical protein